MKILVTGAGGDIGEACARILREDGRASELIGADSGGRWPGQDSFDRMVDLPPGTHSDYGQLLAATIKREGIDLAIVLTEDELRHLVDHPVVAASLPLLVARPNNLVATFLDKLSTIRWLEENGIAAPRTSLLADCSAEDLPVVVKPRRNHGAREILVVTDRRHLEAVRSELDGDSFVSQEYLRAAEREYTCALFRNGTDLRMLIMRRWLEGGTTVRIVVEHDERVEEMLTSLANAAGFDGSINVQLRLTDHGPRIFEINPRFSGTLAMRHHLGFKDLIWSIDALGGHVPPPFEPPIGNQVFRRSRELVVSVDQADRS